MGAERGAVEDRPYDLVAFDAAGEQRPEAAGPAGDELTARVADEGPTDVFLLSHGWNGDVPAARRQYDAWVTAMAACPADQDAARSRPGGFRPVVVGVHWPSKAWGAEDLGPASFALSEQDTAASDPVQRLLEDSATGLPDLPAVRDAVGSLIDAALEDPVPMTLPASVRAAYAQLDAALGAAAEGEGGMAGVMLPAGCRAACRVARVDYRRVDVRRPAVPDSAAAGGAPAASVAG